ncbi:hypothetical protein MBLNU13_g04285t1 [Cladosporium sp. NU13]
MKNILLLFIVALLCTFAHAGLNPGDWGKGACIRRAPNVQKAIEFYCRPAKGTAGRYVPGGAGNRVSTPVGNARVTIDAGCNPAQWLPWDICFKQFYSMCVSGNGRGENERLYGRNRCQRWKISNPK